MIDPKNPPIRKLHGNTVIPPWTISFPDEEFISTWEICEELDIGYTTLHRRIKKNGFPPPEIDGHNGHMASYRKSTVIRWLKANGFKVEG